MQKQGKATPVVMHFDSWPEYVTYAQSQPTDMPKQSRASRREEGTDEYSFTKVKTFDEAIKLANEGWTKGGNEMKSILEPVFSHISKMIERVEVNHDLEGHAIDVARYVDGEPECWMKFEDVLQDAEMGNKLIRITFNMCVSSGISTKTIMRKGAAIAALTELLEYAGHRVEIILCDANGVVGGFFGGTKENQELNFENYVVVKPFNQNLDPSIVSMALAHPATFRRLEFSVMECLPADLRREIGVGSGYGNVADVPKAKWGDIHIGPSMLGEPQWENEKATEKWLLEQLKKQGIHLKKETV